jgi:hypothetical protein
MVLRIACQYGCPMQLYISIYKYRSRDQGNIAQFRLFHYFSININSENDDMNFELRYEL